MEKLVWFLVIAVLTGVVLLIRYFINAAINKGADAIHNKFVDKKNEQLPSQPKNLADQYRD